MLEGMRDKFEGIGQQEYNKGATKKNMEWLLDNRQDLVDNYPNRWIAIDEESVKCVNIDFQEVFQIMEGRVALSGSLVFYFSNLFRVPMILQLCDAQPPQAIS